MKKKHNELTSQPAAIQAQKAHSATQNYSNTFTGKNLKNNKKITSAEAYLFKKSKNTTANLQKTERFKIESTVRTCSKIKKKEIKRGSRHFQQQQKKIRIVQRNLKRAFTCKSAKVFGKTKKQTKIIALPKIKSNNKEREKQYAMRSRRVLKKVKKLKATRQESFVQNERAAVRRFLSTRIAVKSAKKYYRTTIRQAAKNQLLKNLTVTVRPATKKFFKLHSAAIQKINASSFATEEKALLKKQFNFLKTAAANKEKKFMQKWKYLLRSSNDKKRLWKNLLSGNLLISKRTKNRWFVKIKVKSKPSKRLRVRARKRRKMHIVNKKKLLPVKTKQLILKKMRAQTTQTFSNLSVRWLRQKKKALFQRHAKKKISRRRKKWFSKAVRRAISDRPAHLKPWEPEPISSTWKNWIKVFYHKKLLQKIKNRTLQKTLQRKKNAPKQCIQLARKKAQLKNRDKGVARRLKYAANKKALPCLRFSQTLLLKIKEKTKQQLAVNQKKELTLQLPYLMPYYRIKAKFQNKKNRKGVTKKNRALQQTINFRRWRTALKIQKTRRNLTVKQTKKVKPFKNLALVTRAEKKKRRITGVKLKKMKLQLLRKKWFLGQPNVIGVKRKRFVFITANGSNKRPFLHKTARQLLKEKNQSETTKTVTKKLQQNRVKMADYTASNNKKLKAEHAKQIMPVTARIKRNDKSENKKIKTNDIRPRALGAGRIKNTFDSTLRKQYSQKISVLYKKKKNYGSTWLLTSKRTRQENKSEVKNRLKKTNDQLLELNENSYYSRKRRLAVKADINTNEPKKLGFAKTRSKLLKRLALATLRQQNTKTNIGSNGVNEELMRAALLIRRSNRQLRNLRRLVKKNRIIRIKTRPFWVKRKYGKKVRRAKAATYYSISEDSRFERPYMNKWVVNDLKVGVSWKNTKAAQLKTITGENIKTKVQVQRIQAVEYLRKKLKYKKRLLQKQRKKKLKMLRIKKQAIHRAARKVKQAIGRFKRKRRKKLKALKLTKFVRKYRLEKQAAGRTFKKQLSYHRSRRQLTIKTISKLMIKVKKEKEKLGEAFSIAKEPNILLTPFHFKRPANVVTASIEENKKWQRHIQAIQKQKYSRLSELSAGLIAIIPNLISTFIGQSALKLTKNQVKRAVVAAYWNLRLMFQQGHRNKKFHASDINKKQLVRVKREIEEKASHHFFDEAAVKRTRYRFQPHQLSPAVNLQRGADDWIRQYLPKFYDLYLEDTEKYKHLMITPIKIFRAHPNVVNTKKWETRANPSTIEAQYKRLTRCARGRSSSRFENMLITAKRVPAINGIGARTSGQIFNAANSLPPQTSFFARRYTTYIQKNRVVFNKLNSTTKYETKNEDKEKEILLKKFNVIKHRAALKMKMRHVSKHETELNGTIDIRLSRLKSLRSGAFVERLGQHTVKKNKAILLIPKKSNEVVGNTSAKIKLSARRFTKKIKKTAGLLPSIRQLAATRRALSSLRIKKEITQKKIPATKQKRLGLKETKNNNSMYNLSIKQSIKNVLSTSTQSILHNRNAIKRKNAEIEEPTIVIPTRAFQIKRQLRKRAKKYALYLKMARRLSKKEVYVDKTAQIKNNIKKQQWKTKTSKQVKISLLPIAVEQKKTVLSTHGAENTKQNKKKISFVFKKQHKLKQKKHNAKNIQKNFVKRFKSIRASHKKINKSAVKQAVRQEKSLWDTRRKELWRQLTSRWMKRRRILKRWLKGIKYSFKEKFHWTFGGEHALPEELFKLSRSRLKKLEWKKTDGKFEHKGFKKKMTMRPSEKRVAPWLEGLLYSRALYSTQRLAIRRYQLPKDQKTKKWLQKAKKKLFKRRPTHLYIRRKQWPQLRMYNQRLSRSLFHIRSTKAAVKRFQKLNRKKANNSGFEVFAKGHLDRLDVNLILMNFAPSTFWARAMAKSGLISINGQTVTDYNTRFLPGDRINWDSGQLKIYKKYFDAYLNKWEKFKELKDTSRRFPKNMEYVSKLNELTYKNYPKENDLASNGRVNNILFKWFRLDSCTGK